MVVLLLLALPFAACAGLSAIDFGRGLAGSVGVPLAVDDTLFTRVLRLLDRGVTLGLKIALIGVASASVPFFGVVCFGVAGRTLLSASAGSASVASLASRGVV